MAFVSRLILRFQTIPIYPVKFVVTINDIPIKEVVLFGSYAKGNYHVWRYIDLALVSEAFEGERFRDRNKIRQIKLEISCDLEPLPYPPEDFTTDDPFVQKIIETGMRVV